LTQFTQYLANRLYYRKIQNHSVSMHLQRMCIIERAKKYILELT